MTTGRGTAAIAALVMILVITASWWSLALWPMGTAAPEWLARTRYVCFGATRSGLPDAGGWILLVGQPAGMVLLLLVVWGEAVRAGFARLLARTSGQLSVGVVAAGLLMGIVGVGVRVRSASAEPFNADGRVPSGETLTRIDDLPPALGLVNQAGDTVRLGAFTGRAVLLTFAFGNCETVCPLVVHSALAARDRVAQESPERAPVILVVTVDPWRDTPSRLGSIAAQWGMSGDAYVLSGNAEVVEGVLNRWRIPRARNLRTGDVTHPSLVYVIGPAGRINYALTGTAEQIVAALKSL